MNYEYDYICIFIVYDLRPPFFRFNKVGNKKGAAQRRVVLEIVDKCHITQCNAEKKNNIMKIKIFCLKVIYLLALIIQSWAYLIVDIMLQF